MTQKARVAIDLALPAMSDDHDACVRRLTDLLKTKKGVEATHITDTNSSASSKICIDYDPNRFSIVEIREIAQPAGAKLDRFGHLLIHAKSMQARQSRTSESRVKQIRGVLEASISAAGVVRIEFDC